MTGFPWNGVDNRALKAEDLNAAFAEAYAQAAQALAAANKAMAALSAVSPFILPPATTVTLGGVMADGHSLDVDPDGTLHVATGTTAGTAAAGDDPRITGALQAATAAATYQPVLGYTAYDAANPGNFQSGTQVSGAITGALSGYLPTSAIQATYAPLASPVFTGAVTIPSGAAIADYLTSANAAATYQTALGYAAYDAANPAGYQSAAQVSSAITSSLGPYARLASPVFTGQPSGPTATPGANTTQFATTQFVTAAVVASTTGVAYFNGRTGNVTLSSSDVTTALTFTPPQPGSATPAMNGTGAAGASASVSHQDHVHPTDTTRAPLASPTFSGSSLTASNSADTQININAGVNRSAAIHLQKAGADRWILSAFWTPSETGSNTGSDLVVQNCADAGTTIGTVININRASGLVTLSNGLAVTGTVSGAGFTGLLQSPGAIGNVAANSGSFTTLAASSTVSGAGFATYLASYLASPAAIGGTTPASGSFTTLAASSTVSGTGFSTYLASPPAIGGTTPASGSFTTLAASSTVSGTGFSTYLASPPAIGGTTQATGAFTTVTLGAGGATTPAMTFNAAAGFSRNVLWQTGGLARWIIGPTGGETGSNVGCDLGFGRYDDAGSWLGYCMTITRASGMVTFGNTVTISSTLQCNSTVSGAGFTARFAAPGPIGNSTPSTGAFTTLSASGAVSGAGITSLFASPPAIGGTAAAAGAFTTLASSGAYTIGSGGATLTGCIIQATGTNTSYLQESIQNLSAGGSASSDVICTADTGTDSVGYIDLGINSSGYNDATFTISGPLDGYLYTASTHLAIGTAGAGRVIRLFTGGTLLANQRGYVDDTGLNGCAIGATTPSSAAVTTLAASGNVSGGGVTSTVPGMLPAPKPIIGQGIWFTTPAVGITGVVSVTANRQYFVPVYLPTGILAQLAVYMTTATTAGNVRWGLYTDAGGPGTLLYDGGAFAITASIALKASGALSSPPGLVAGWYWASAVFSAAVASLQGISPAVIAPPMGVLPPTTGLAYAYGATTYGALPASPPTLTWGGAASICPNIYVSLG